MDPKQRVLKGMHCAVYNKYCFIVSETMKALEKLLADIKRINSEIKANLSSKYIVWEPKSEKC